nr:hypothetical protein [Angustibacter aerolatus]
MTSADLTVGYAAMLEQFHPTEAVALTALAEQHGFSGCMAADHFQPWVPQQGQASLRVERADRGRRADDGRHGAGGHLPELPVPPGGGGAGRGDAGGHVPGPIVARPGHRRGAERARRPGVLAGGR